MKLPHTLYDVTNSDWAPTLNLGYNAVGDHTMQASTERYKRAPMRRKVIRNEDDVEVDDYKGPLMTDDEYGNDDKESRTAVQTELTFGLGLAYIWLRISRTSNLSRDYQKATLRAG